jgi:hypothetical protein
MRIMLASILSLLAAAALAQTSPERAAIVAGDPPAAAQRLRLVDLPRPSRAARALFNGRDLECWHPWLGYADPSITFRAPPGAEPIGGGFGVDASEIFSVVSEDGAPAIRAGGRYWGSLAFCEDWSDYHLSLEYKWGPAEAGAVRNNGVVYHSHGMLGGVFGTWTTGMEFQLQHGSNGMAIPMGNAIRTRTTVAQDMALIYPHRRFRIGGRAIDLANGNPAYSVEAANDAERPVGEWNRIDLYVVGDRAVHVVNNVPVMVLEGIAEVDARGRRRPLTHGYIQLQAEGPVTYFRNISIEPIRRLPRVVVEP